MRRTGSRRTKLSYTAQKRSVVMKWSYVSRLVSMRSLGAWGAALSLGLVAGCGDDEGAATTNESDAAVVGGDAAAGDVTSETPAETTETDPNPTGGQGQNDAGGGGDSIDGVDAGGQSGCGGAGEPCCARATCGGGLVCVVQEPQWETDGGLRGLVELVGIGADGGWFTADAGLVPSDIIPTPIAVCEPCGGDGQRCCADDGCNKGLSCEAAGSELASPRMCSAEPAEGDAGAVDTSGDCGNEGQVCCRDQPADEAYCKAGLACEDPPGLGLVDSNCVADNDGTDTSSECGGLEQPCCEGRGNRGACDDGLECDSRAPRGLEGDVCVEE